MSQVCGAIGRALLLPFRAIVYVFNPCNWCNTADELKNDARIALKEVVDGKPRICLQVKMLESSAHLGMRIMKVEAGWVAFSISRTTTHKLKKMKQKDIDDLHREYPSIKFSKEERTAVIEIDILDIRERFNKKNAIIGEIVRRINTNLKALSKATDTYKTYGDRTLVHGIAKVLHDSHEYVECKPMDINAYVDGMLIIVVNKGMIANLRGSAI